MDDDAFVPPQEPTEPVAGRAAEPSPGAAEPATPGDSDPSALSDAEALFTLASGEHSQTAEPPGASMANADDRVSPAAAAIEVAGPDPSPREPPPRKLSRQEKLDLLVDVPLTITAELGRTVLPIADVLSLDHGSVIELDRAPADPIDLLVNGQLVAKGEVVVVDDNFGVRITKIVGPGEATTGGRTDPTDR